LAVYGFKSPGVPETGGCVVELPGVPETGGCVVELGNKNAGSLTSGKSGDIRLMHGNVASEEGKASGFNDKSTE